ncbi:hypothetical protein, partial [Pseudomonas sp. FSL R10-0071]|uniref:hypothetical protein n=1 Tax=Pseudomonas sp. FSL R10-0071 TaxID=2662193 RepID=UPI001C49C69F
SPRSAAGVLWRISRWSSPLRTSASPAPAANQTAEEQRQALEQWLRQIPDNPAELLRRKFWYEQQLHQDTPK